MLGLFLTAAGLVAAALAIGLGIGDLAGWRGRRGWAAGVGLAAIVVLGGQVSHSPRLVTPVAVTMLVLAVLALLRPGVRRALASVRLPDVWPAAVVLLAAGLPFLLAGRTGVLGPGVSDDMSAHLAAADWLRTRAGLLPVAALGQPILGAGYPVGPHGVVAGLRALFGLDETNGFGALLLATPVATTLAVQGALPRVRGRGAVAALGGLAYLVAAYLTQSAFKETLIALFLVATAGLLDDLSRGRGHGHLGRRLVPAGVLVAASAYVYGAPGAAWPIGAMVVFALVTAVRARGTGGLRAGALARLALPALGVAFVLTAPDALRLARFSHSSLSGGRAGGQGNLFHALNPLEATGVWLSGDFRVAPGAAWLSIAAGALALVALALGLGWWWRERRLAPPAALVAAIGLWAELALTRNPYAAAKGLAIVAPVFALCLAGPLLAAWGSSPGRRGLRAAARPVGVVLLVLAALSSFSALRAATVGLGGRSDDLATLRGQLRPGRVFFLGIDHYAQWLLRGTDLYEPPQLYGQQIVVPRGSRTAPYDVDDFPAYHLDRITWLVQPASAFTGAVPPNFRLVRRTPFFRVYRRHGTAPVRGSVEPAGMPGGILDCKSPSGARALRRYRGAAVLPTPVLRHSTAWRGQPDRPGRAGRVRLDLPAGRWDVSLAYESDLPLRIDAPGLRRSLPRIPDGFSPYVDAGTLVARGGPVTVTVRAQPAHGLARLLGARPAPTVAQTQTHQPVRVIAFTRHGIPPRLVPTPQACGRWVDWLRVAAP